MNLEFLKAQPEHLDEMCIITDQAKAQLRGLGLDQWQYGYPCREVWEDDVQKGIGYVAVLDGRVVGAFAYLTTPEEDYAKIDGAWKTDGEYASVHRVCVADGMKGRGIAPAMFAEAARMAKQDGMPSVRIDTHPGNIPMQHALAKGGFEFCGMIRLARGVEAGHLRRAYEMVL